ncbi:MAG: DUF3352 domain-containing protein [Planctomycetota bacterium]|nr:DUF3352 domain-containing protein [Planctomycetota bacterium]
MFTKRCLPLAVRVGLVVALCLAATSALRAGEPAKAPRIADILPDGTILFVECSPWKNWSEDFKKTAPAQILEDPEVRSFLEGPISRLSALFTSAGQPKPAPEAKPPEQPGTAGAAAATLLNTLSSLTRGPFSVAVRYSADDAKAQKTPAVAIMLGADDPNIGVWMTALAEGVKKDPEVKLTVLATDLLRRKIEGLRVKDYGENAIITVAPSKDAAANEVLAVALCRKRLLISNELQFCTQLIDGIVAPLPTNRLSNSEAYKNCGLTGDEHMLAYLDIASLQKAIGAVAKPAPQAATTLDELLGRVGLKQATAVAWSLKMNGPAFESRTAIFTKGEREGLLGALAEGELSPDALKICPDGAPLAVGLRLKPGQVLAFLHGAFKTLDKGSEKLEAVEKEYNVQAGHNLEKELGEAFGGEVVITSLASQTNTGTVDALSAFAASLPVQNQEKAGALLDDVLTRLAAKCNPDAGAKAFRKLEGTPICYFDAPAASGLLVFSPAFAIQGGRLVMALDVPTLKNALRTMQAGPWLADSKPFKTALENAGGKTGTAFSYVDWPYVYRAVVSSGTSALRMISRTGVLGKAGIDLNLLPSTESVASHLCPSLSVARITPNGFVLASRSPLPSLEVLVPPVAAVTVVFASFQPFVLPEKEKK